MSVESIIGITSGLISIGGLALALYNRYKKQSLSDLMVKLTDSRLSTKQHQNILKKMNRKLVGAHIKEDYIQGFALKNRGKEAIFKEICIENEIEPTSDICKKFLNADMPKFREEYSDKKKKVTAAQVVEPEASPSLAPTTGLTVYMSELLKDKYPKTCENLIAILEKHHVNYAFLKGTKDIWCRDYMPVRLESGKLIQFRYEPSYLMEDSKYEAIRSDVHEVCRQNNINAQDSDINLDGGNVLICDGQAIISDRVFSENKEKDPESLKKELAQLLECEIIIIPTINGDLTGHADGMVRFVDRNTILGNNRAKEFKYWRDGINEVLMNHHLNYIDVPFFEPKRDSKHPDSAIGVYVNFLEVNNLIIAPVFNNDMDKEVVAVLQKAFPGKLIETIDYSDVALEGGLLNCTTWVA